MVDLLDDLGLGFLRSLIPRKHLKVYRSYGFVVDLELLEALLVLLLDLFVSNLEEQQLHQIVGLRFFAHLRHIDGLHLLDILDFDDGVELQNFLHRKVGPVFFVLYRRVEHDVVGMDVQRPPDVPSRSSTVVQIVLGGWLVFMLFQKQLTNLHAVRNVLRFLRFQQGQVSVSWYLYPLG